MSKKTSLPGVLTLLVLLTSGLCFAQTQTLDSLRNVVQEVTKDSITSATEIRRVLSAYLYQAKSNNSQEDVIYAYQQLAAVNYNSGNINQALKYYKLYVLELEELTEFEEYRDQQFEMNLYENEIRALKKQIAELEQENKTLTALKDENFEQNHLIYIGLRIAFGIAIVLIIGWVYQQYRKTKTKKAILPEPISSNQELTGVLNKTKAELVSAQTELSLADILVQQEIISPDQYFTANKSLRRKFLINQPRELASGAGLFLHTIKHSTLFAIFNSASSGASGGLLAVQIYHQLDELVKNLNITSPALILEQLEDKLSALFPAGIPFAGGISCGIGLYNSTERTITYCGANIDLYRVQNSTHELYSGGDEPILIGATKGVMENRLIEVGRGSNFYLSSAAYWQQEGGHEYKALGRESFEKTIVSIEKQNAEEQQRVLSKVFEEWRGGNEQNSDVLVFGFML